LLPLLVSLLLFSLGIAYTPEQKSKDRHVTIAPEREIRQKRNAESKRTKTGYSIIDQHLARHFKNNGAGLLSTPSFLFSQIITPFSHLMLSSNQERGLCI
jgi:hypothetical protein